MASSSQVRSRADRKTHMFSVPSSSRLAASPAARRLIGRLHHRLELCISGGLENFPEPAELVTETAGVKAKLRQQVGVLAIIGVYLVRELLAGLLRLVVVALALQQLHDLVFADVHELSFPSNW
jgi:hypothetical protein